MLALLISLTLSFSVYFVTGQTGWSIFGALAVFVLIQVAFGLLMRKKIGLVQNKIQAVIMDGQKRINAKVTMMQQKGNTNISMMQKMLESDQKVFLNEALELTKELEPFVKWSMLLGKQIATMRMQFYFQLKEFTKVEENSKRALFLDPMLFCIKMVCDYKKKEFKVIDKTYARAIGRFRGEKSTLLAATYSWMLVKQDRIDDAIKALVSATKKNDNDVLVKNLDLLRNGKGKQLSNSGLGEQWYALGLEEFKQKPVKMRQRVSKGGRPF
ncbi:MAG: hypothetical protein ACRC37_04030 [Lentisphaeria bacterium]